MSTRSLILLLAAALIAGVTAFAVRNRISGTPEVAAGPAPSAERVLVARGDIAHGMFVQAARDLDWVALPPTLIREHHIRESAANIAEFDGAVARRAIQAGEPLTRVLLVKPSDGGFMPAVLEAGKRAVTISVTNISGNAGFVFPGDRVDLILTHKVPIAEMPGGAEKDAIVSETFVEDVRVLAVDQMIDNPENKAIPAKTLTIEVTPQQAEMVGVAADLGKISVSLRSLAMDGGKSKNTESAAQPGIALPDSFMAPEVAAGSKTFTRDSDVSTVLNPHAGTNPHITVIRGGKRENLEFYQGLP